MAKIYFKNLRDKKTIALLNLIAKERPKKADTIVWLQGDRYDRGKKVFSLFKKGWANKIVVSGNNKLIGPNKRVGENNISLDEMVKWLEKKGVKDSQIIVENRSFNTKDQAKNVLRLAKNKKWKKIILVASLYHQPRVFLTFLKEAKRLRWKGIIINQPTNIDLRKKPSGQGKSGKKLFLEEIKKIKKYKKDLISIKESISYLKNAKRIESRK